MTKAKRASRSTRRSVGTQRFKEETNELRPGHTQGT